MNNFCRRFIHTFTIILFILLTINSLCVISSAQEKPQIQKEPGKEEKREIEPRSMTGGAVKLRTEDVAAFLDGLVPLQMKRDDIAGLVIVVVKNGKILYSKGYGYADRENKIPVSVDETMFRPGSISKLFTWTAVMQLVEQGKLDLDTDINEYLDFKIPSTYAEPITLRNIMTHRSGFEDGIKELFVARPEDMFTLGEYLSGHMPSRIFPPGKTPAYSNYASALAGYIVQRVSGEKFEDYISAHIFEPLGMTHSSFIQPLPENLKPLMSQGYRLGSGKPQIFEIVTASPAGALSTTGADIARFMITQLQDGEYNGNRILSPETVSLMHSRQPGYEPGMNGMCLGFYEESLNGERIIGHGGDTMWFHSDLHLIPDKNLGFYISINSAGQNSKLRGSVWLNFLDRYFPFNLSPANPPAEKLADAKLVTSRSYMASRRGETNFSRNGAIIDQLTFSSSPDGTIQSSSIRALNGQPRQFEEIGPLTYREVDGKARIQFTQTDDGEIILNPGMPIAEFNSVPWYLSRTFFVLLLITSIIIPLLTLIFWIIAALVRRHYGRSLELDIIPRIIRLGTRIGCVFILISYIAWSIPVIRIAHNFAESSANLDGWLHLAQILTIVSIVLTIIALINSVTVWFQKRWWWSKIWETLVGLACLTFVWFAIIGQLWEWSDMF